MPNSCFRQGLHKAHLDILEGLAYLAAPYPYSCQAHHDWLSGSCLLTSVITYSHKHSLGAKLGDQFHLHHEPCMKPQGRDQLTHRSGPPLPVDDEMYTETLKMGVKSTSTSCVVEILAQAGCVCNITKSKYDG